MKDRIAGAEKELENLRPTPPVGSTVIWYQQAKKDPSNQKAAVVTKVEGAGKISLTAFPFAGVPRPTICGCLHCDDPAHAPNNAVSVNNGSWDYVDGTNPPKSHLKVHEDEIRRKIASFKVQLEQAEEVNAKAAESEAPAPAKASPAKVQKSTDSK